MAAAAAPRVELDHLGFRLGLLPSLGGALTHLVWTPPEHAGAGFDLMRRSSAADIASGNPSRLASFVMVPFTNRIDGGKFPAVMADGQTRVVTIPVNRPSQNAAIHGFGRLAAWAVAHQSSDRLRLTQTFAVPGIAYVYDAEQSFSIEPGAVRCRLSVANRGSESLPFGIGFHPWFDRTAGARLAFAASSAFRMDDRDMPIEPIPLEHLTGGSPGSGQHDFVVAQRTPFDTPIGGWDGKATLTWPEKGLVLDMEATGFLRVLHVFSPADPAVFCVEPVSHMPDVVNRRQLAPYGDMQMLSPGQSMTGEMILRPRRLG